MYEQQRVSECEYILKDSGAKLLLVSKETIYDKVRGRGAKGSRQALVRSGQWPGRQAGWTEGMSCR